MKPDYSEYIAGDPSRGGFILNEIFSTKDSNDRTRLKKVITDDVMINARRVAQTLMIPIRDFARDPIIVTSWVRDYPLNHKVGGMLTSKHLLGLAVDFTVYERAQLNLIYDFIGESDLPFSELGLYQQSNGHAVFIHVAGIAQNIWVNEIR